MLFCYPVISRRSKGLSIGVNLNPDQACNYDCVYCEVDRTHSPRVRTVDLPRLELELRALAGGWRELFDDPAFVAVPEAYRRLNDIAFSGDGEPTAAPAFTNAVEVVARVRRELGLTAAKVIVITNACFLTRPAVVQSLRVLDENGGEIWAKLDAGTEAYHERINRPSHPLVHVLDNILAAARVRPLVIQSLFCRFDGAPPDDTEIGAYVDRLATLLAQGAQLSLVQIYTVARIPAVRSVAALSASELESIARRVRSLGVPAESFA